MNRRLLQTGLIVSLCLVPTICLRAQSPLPQTSPVSLPAGKLLNPAPENSQWTIDISAGQTRAANARPAPAQKSPPRITVVKSGPIKHVTGVVFNGTAEELWIDGSTEVMLAPGMERPVIFDGNGSVDPYYTRYCRADFPGFEWIAAGNFVGEMAYGSRKCLVFRGTTKTDAPALDATGETGPALAYIDEETRLPVYLEKDGQTFVFRFGDPPTSPIRLPPELATAVAASKNHIPDLTRLPARPY